MSIAQLTRCEPGDELLLTCVASTQPKSCEKCAWCGPPFTRGCLGELSREKLALSQISHRHAASRYHPSHISPRAPVAPRPLRLRPPRAAAHTDSVLFHFLSSYFLSTASAVLRAGVGYGYGVERCHPGPGRGQAEQFPPRNAQGCGAGGRHYSRHVRRTACTPGLSQVSQLASPKLNLDPAHCGLVHQMEAQASLLAYSNPQP